MKLERYQRHNRKMGFPSVDERLMQREGVAAGSRLRRVVSVVEHHVAERGLLAVRKE
jgi:hypothetical protein